MVGLEFALDRHLDREGLAVRQQPLAAALLEARLLQQLARGLGIALPPAAAEGGRNLVRGARDLVAQGGAQHTRKLLAHVRIVGPDLLLAGIDLEGLQPGFHGLEIVFRIEAGRRHADGRDRGGAPIGGHRHGLDVDQQRQCPAHVLVLELLDLVVEQHGRQGRVGMAIGKPLEPGLGRLRFLGDREHALGRRVVDDVELVVHVLDHALVRRAGIDVGDIAGPRLAEPCQRRPLPVFAALPDEPPAVGVEAVQRVGAQRDRGIEVELARVRRLLEDVLGQDPGGIPAHREDGVEARVRLLELEDDGRGIGCRDAGHIDLEGRAPDHARMVDLGLHGVDDVVGGELDPVAPMDAGAQLHRHLAEVVVVGRLVRSQRVVPDTVDAVVRVDVPQGIHGELLVAGRAAAGIDGPHVEPAGVLDRPFRVLDDQGLVARKIGDDFLRVGRDPDRQRASRRGSGRHEPAPIHRSQKLCLKSHFCLPDRCSADCEAPDIVRPPESARLHRRRGRARAVAGPDVIAPQCITVSDTYQIEVTHARLRVKGRKPGFERLRLLASMRSEARPERKPRPPDRIDGRRLARGRDQRLLGRSIPDRRTA